MPPALRKTKDADLISLHTEVFGNAFGDSGPGHRTCSIRIFTQTIGEALEFGDKAHRFLKLALLTSRPEEGNPAVEFVAQQDSIFGMPQLSKQSRAVTDSRHNSRCI